jgi:hypothetical protein
VFRLEAELELQQVRDITINTEEKLTPWLEGCLLYEQPDKITRVAGLYRRAHEEYSLGALRLTNLPTLIRLNLLNALIRNSHHIGIQPHRLCRDEFMSPFNQLGPLIFKDPIRDNCPKSLQPTKTQRRIFHHPWIDLLPFPMMRDNILLEMEAGGLDDDELSYDLMEFGSGNGDLARRPALIVWGEPSAASSWEVNVAFLRKWGHLLRGCAELISATNAWRCKRGEHEFSFMV